MVLSASLDFEPLIVLLRALFYLLVLLPMKAVMAAEKRWAVLGKSQE